MMWELDCRPAHDYVETVQLETCMCASWRGKLVDWMVEVRPARFPRRASGRVFARRARDTAGGATRGRRSARVQPPTPTGPLWRRPPP